MILFNFKIFYTVAVFGVIRHFFLKYITLLAKKKKNPIG